MKVLVLGGAGYIGSVLCDYLDSQGDEVMAFDNLLYETELSGFGPQRFFLGDIRNVFELEQCIKRYDAVVNLAALSNDPLSDLDPDQAMDINFRANEQVAELCRRYNKKAIYASSCSVYGFSENEIFNEDSQVDPVTLYAKTKMLSEKFYSSPDLDAVILRFATVYGFSKKPRFDLVVNTMIGTGYFENKIVVNGGAQWRPVIHVRDVAHAIYLSLHATRLNFRVLNVGSNEQNYKIEDLGKMIAAKMPNATFVCNKDSTDKRSYRVDFSRIQRVLNFRPKYVVNDAVLELKDAFEKKIIGNMQQDVYYRVKYLKNGGGVKKIWEHNIKLR